MQNMQFQEAILKHQYGRHPDFQTYGNIAFPMFPKNVDLSI